MKNKVTSEDVYRAVLERLEERGITLESIAEIVLKMQRKYIPDLKLEHCMEHVQAVLRKREILHAILVGAELDRLAQQNLLSEPLLSLVRNDEGLFGCDETLALGMVMGYGSIAVTTFGHLDKQKIGIIKDLDTKKGGPVNTFMDDLVAGIAAAASSRLAHKMRDQEEKAEMLELQAK